MSNGKRADPKFRQNEHCRECGSKETRYLRRTNTVYCRRCGYEWPAPVRKPDKQKGVK